MSDLNTFEPDRVSPAGDTIKDIIRSRGWKQTDFSKRTGWSEKHVSLLFNGKAPITEGTAAVLEQVLGGPSAKFWLTREAHYRAELLRLKQDKKYRKWVRWLRQIPIRELMNNGYIEKSRQTAGNKPRIVREALKFYGVASPKQWKSCFEETERMLSLTKKRRQDMGAVSALLRTGEIEAEEQGTPAKYGKVKFRKAIARIRNLTVEKPQEIEHGIEKLCFDAGVHLAITPAFRKAHVSSIARWLRPNRPLIQLPLYGKTNDQFWLTFFHEAGHILLHQSRRMAFWDDKIMPDENRLEKEASQFAINTLIPKQYSEQLKQASKSAHAIRKFAKELNIHPGVVVGCLQHQKHLPRNTPLNKLKVIFPPKDRHKPHLY